MNIEVLAILTGVAIVLSGIAITIGCIGLSIIVGLKNSTHKIQYVPIEHDETDEELEKRKVDQAKEYESAAGFRDEEEDWI